MQRLLIFHVFGIDVAIPVVFDVNEVVLAVVVEPKGLQSDNRIDFVVVVDVVVVVVVVVDVVVMFVEEIACLSLN